MQTGENLKKLKYFSYFFAPVLPPPPNETSKPFEMETHLQQNALAALFLTHEEMAPLAPAEIAALYHTFCAEAPTYSDTELETFCQTTSFLPNEFALSVKHLPLLDLLEFALLQGSDKLLQLLPLHISFDHIQLFYYTYIKLNHYDYPPVNNHALALARLTDCLLKFSSTEPTVLPLLLEWAVNGERQQDIYHMRDSYNYFHPNLSVVKKLVPAYFTATEALQCYNEFAAATYSYNGCSESHYEYEKNAPIFAYLSAL